MLLDSNIVIYSIQPAYADLRRFIAEHRPAVSVISYVEVLGFHKLTAGDRSDLEALFAELEMLPVTRLVLDRAVALRQARKMSLGDALIAATALAHELTLVTRNVSDYACIPNLKFLNPLPT